MIYLAHLLPNKSGIPVLMYHKVMPGTEDFLTVNPHTLAQQWQWLQQEGYKAIALGEYLQLIQKPLPALPYKPLLITFDDGYYNNYEYAYPLLQKMDWCATVFVIARTLIANQRTEADIDKMTVADYRKMDSNTIQLALHGYEHEHFSLLSPQEVGDITDKCFHAYEQAQLPYCKVLAYPYGSRPKGKTALQAMKNVLKQKGITAAFRIGNAIDPLPHTNPYEIKRIDIRGTDTFAQFKLKVKKGRAKLI